jgi:hypothetical protein
MKRNLRIGALAILLIALGWWAACGANRGWTRTSVPMKKLDAVTGLEGIEYQKRFVPGVDFLAVTAAAALALAGLSLLFRGPAPAMNHPEP